MSEIASTALYFLGVIQGIVIGYILWAPSTNFKQGLVDGLARLAFWKKTND